MTLKSFMDHFRAAMLEVHGLEPVVMILVLMRGLRVGGFYHSLSKRFPHNPWELLSYSEKYINAEEGMVEKRRERGEHTHFSIPPR